QSKRNRTKKTNSTRLDGWPLWRGRVALAPSLSLSRISSFVHIHTHHTFSLSLSLSLFLAVSRDRVCVYIYIYTRPCFLFLAVSRDRVCRNTDPPSCVFSSISWSRAMSG
ncbi:hypothetical protein X777_08875, partial [Ooceraea biroi]